MSSIEHQKNRLVEVHIHLGPFGSPSFLQGQSPSGLYFYTWGTYVGSYREAPSMIMYTQALMAHTELCNRASERFGGIKVHKTHLCCLSRVEDFSAFALCTIPFCTYKLGERMGGGGEINKTKEQLQDSRFLAPQSELTA
jgi:hypothetical protein